MDDGWDPQPLREFLQEVMRRNGWNQGELARAVHTSGSVVGRWLSGENRPTPEKLRQVAEGLRVDHDELLMRVGYREARRDAPSARHADLYAKLDRVTLNDFRYRTLTAILSEWGEQGHAVVERPTG